MVNCKPQAKFHWSFRYFGQWHAFYWKVKNLNLIFILKKFLNASPKFNCLNHLIIILSLKSFRFSSVYIEPQNFAGKIAPFFLNGYQPLHLEWIFKDLKYLKLADNSIVRKMILFKITSYLSVVVVLLLTKFIRP